MDAAVFTRLFAKARMLKDKGQRAQVQRVCANVLNGEAAPIGLDELATTTRATFRILDTLRSKCVVSLE